jgi:hypothetical protein
MSAQLFEPLRFPELRVHPLADIFPMLPDDELAELAEDIRVNGLITPIMMDATGDLLIDGRNRLAACKIAGIPPRFDRLERGQDARAYIVSANLHRRNLAKGQQAMALAMIYPETEKGGRGVKSSAVNSAVSAGFSSRRLNEARFVLRMGRDDLAPAVIGGRKSLDDALIEARQRQNKSTSEETQSAKLRAEAPDLADLVIEERMSLPEAIAAANQRAEDRRRAIDAGRRASVNLVDFAGVAVTIAAAAELGERGLVTADHLARLDDAMILLRRIYEDDANET